MFCISSSCVIFSFQFSVRRARGRRAISNIIRRVWRQIFTCKKLPQDFTQGFAGRFFVTDAVGVKPGLANPFHPFARICASNFAVGKTLPDWRVVSIEKDGSAGRVEPRSVWELAHHLIDNGICRAPWFVRNILPCKILPASVRGVDRRSAIADAHAELGGFIFAAV
jgi:hypothetical protein